MQYSLEKIVDFVLTPKAIRDENRHRKEVVRGVTDIVGRAWTRVDELIQSPVWEYDDEEHKKVRTRWFAHGLDEGLLATTYLVVHGLPRDVAPQNHEDVAFGFIIHDIGKIESVDPAVWYKHFSEITAEDKKGMQAHVDPYGVKMIHKLRKNGVVIPPISEEILLFHHERINGSGKPYELEGHDISFWARLAAGVDSVISRAENHSYQFPNQSGRFSLRSASEHVTAEAGVKFDAEIMENLNNLLQYHTIYFTDVLKATDGWYRSTSHAQMILSDHSL